MRSGAALRGLDVSARDRCRSQRVDDRTGRRDQLDRAHQAFVGGHRLGCETFHDIESRGQRDGEICVDRSAHLRRGAGEIDDRIAATDFDRDANWNRAGAEAVVVEKILRAISSRGKFAERRDHQALGVILEPVNRSFDRFASRGFHNRQQAFRSD
jgi:hypothetical protein